MKKQNTGLRKEIILLTSIGLLIVSVTSFSVKLYFSIPSSIICFLCEAYAIANRINSRKHKFIFSVFSPFCFLFLHFWLLCLLEDIPRIMENLRSTYTVGIGAILVLDWLYCSLIRETPRTTVVHHSNSVNVHTDLSNSDHIISSEKPVQTMSERIELYNDEFDYMSGAEFEEYCADLLRRNGFVDVKVTSASGDFGVDILAAQNKTLYAVQCKCYSSDVGVDAVYQVTGGMKYYNANVGAVLTNQHFTRQARELASKIGVVLWDREFLVSLINSRTVEASPISMLPREYDIYFEDAGKFVIEKQTISVGMLQRMFKIGFNRAARIMDQLCDAGVVGPADGTEYRKVLMSMEEFENYLETHYL